MGLLESLGFNQTIGGSHYEEIPNTFPFTYQESTFIDNDLRTVYSRILTDTLTRTHGLKEELESLLWDNCLSTEAQDGLVTMLAKAMLGKKEVGIVYDKATNVVRKATDKECQEIKESYVKGKPFKNGILVTFKNYDRTDMLKLYSALEYCSIASLNKSMRVSMALQYKIDSLRATVNLIDKDAAKKQAASVAGALKNGQDTYMDAKDSIVQATPDMTATNAAMDLISQKRSFYLELPASYITGLAAKGGLGDTGEGDSKAIERGLKGYYYSIIKPVLEALFDVKVSFKGEDFYGLSTAGEMLKTFSVTDNELISLENKTLIVNKLFGLPEDAKGDAPEPTPNVIPLLRL